MPVVQYLADKQLYKDLLNLTSCNNYLSDNMPLNIRKNFNNLNYISKVFKKITYQNIDSIEIHVFTTNYNCNYIELHLVPKIMGHFIFCSVYSRYVYGYFKT